MLEYLKFELGGFFSGPTKVEIFIKNNVLFAESSFTIFADYTNNIILSPEETTQWLGKFENINIKKWKRKYNLDTDICDGEQWEIKYKTSDANAKKITGDNDYPDNWDDFLALLDEIAIIINPMRVDSLQATITDKFDIASTGTYKLKKIVKAESILITNDKMFITQLEDDLKTNYEYSRKNEFEDMLSCVENCEDDFNYKPVDYPQYEIKVTRHSGQVQIFKGLYNRRELPDFWEELSYEIRKYISVCANNLQVMGSHVSGVRDDEFIYCDVSFNEFGSSYFYLTHDDSLEAGMKVVVPVGKDNIHKIGVIENIHYHTIDNVPFPLAKTKVILCRAYENPNHRPYKYENAEIYLDAVYRNTHKNKIHSQITKLLSSSRINFEKIYKKLENNRCILKNYGDYSSTNPVFVDEELRRLETADLELSCAIMTMILREDHFNNGTYDRRLQLGEVNKVLEKIAECCLDNNSRDTIIN